MPMQEVTNMSQGRVIHIDTTMLAPGETGLIDSERAKSAPVKALVSANELKLGGMVEDEGDEPAPKPQASPQPKPPEPKR
jgi:hypothetical protein